jgi:hypothetical protein
MCGDWSLLARNIQSSCVSSLVRHYDVLQHIRHGFLHWHMSIGLRRAISYHCEQTMGLGYIFASYL